VLAFIVLQWFHNVLKQNMAAFQIKYRTLSLQEKLNVIRKSERKSKFYICSTSKRIEHAKYCIKWQHGKGRCFVTRLGYVSSNVNGSRVEKYHKVDDAWFKQMAAVGVSTDGTIICAKATEIAGCN
jgi:hypothetical protein